MLGDDLLAAPVTRPGLTQRSLYVPRGRWFDWWRSTRFAEADGAYRLGSLTPVAPGQTTVPAPLGNPPLLLRAGAVLGLLPADVDTLSPYAGPGIVRASDRRAVRHVIAVPRGRASERLGDGASASYAEGRRRLVLRLRARRRTTWDVELSVAALRRPFTPRRVRGATGWQYDRRTRVVRLRARGTKPLIRLDGLP